MLKHKTIHQNLAGQLPAYLNGTLSDTMRRTIETELQSDNAARAQLAAWQKVQAALCEKSNASPSTNRHQLLEQIKTIPQAPSLTAWIPWTSGIILAAVALIALWIAIQPGINLSWSVQGGTTAVFRVYRASANTNDFKLIQEIPARPDLQTYTYIDTALLPDQNYSYRVEGEQLGLSTVSQAITVSSQEAISDQVLILLISLAIGISAVKLLQYWLESKWVYQLPHAIG